MKRFALILLLIAAAAGSIWSGQPSVRASKKNEVPKILEFETMVGVTPPYTGTTNPIRGVSGGGIPWVLDEAEGKLWADGLIEIKVEGLVLATTGANPATNFKAIVSCLSIDDEGKPITVNVETGLFPADAAGNCVIEDVVDLPEPCIAPIVFVTNAGGRWFSATGF